MLTKHNHPFQGKQKQPSAEKTKHNNHDEHGTEGTLVPMKDITLACDRVGCGMLHFTTWFGLARVVVC
ncbi:unnamed protein product [Pseudo-nitzschia multistriata]|uniref:Uncharacterized protein n=1 Tax=Pseudo-nitzschia multistriata TaxID=183589 RepID=A0A448YWH4_9STRA|nr:unnamed protein product [Pseudo-nitzschia multistriata]